MVCLAPDAFDDPGRKGRAMAIALRYRIEHVGVDRAREDEHSQTKS